ncbi:AlpA family transcriptional regulator [Thiomicrorhabdus sp. 6S2-11]|uniref:AlpA family transcriptional regulator n=1 Tax=Thiomicrorhabdus marina TaxID=2818442 RepID=A0ABS3Q5H6_9GAMM|nr:AlpA family transcriptional regulator [Thiomicrorhabdus marina]MBO1927115.1 AlpA family transcriptional regulator [Thiomicrorhabdus marina]
MILKVNQVAKRCGLSRATIYKKAKEGTFPKQIKLSERSSGWLEEEINEWIEKRVQEREISLEVVS